MELPEHHQQLILAELQKPKSKQKLTEDFFIEMERALKTVSRAMPKVLNDKNLETVRTVLIDKYVRGVINNVVHFRLLAKIARADNVQADPEQAAKSLRRIFSTASYSIEDGYRDSVAEAYVERDLITRASGLTEYLDNLDWAALDAGTRKELRRLHRVLGSLIRAD
jgi:hypothetical protein